MSEQDQQKLANAQAKVNGQEAPYPNASREPTNVNGYTIHWDNIENADNFNSVRDSLLELAQDGNTRAYDDLVRLNWMQVGSHRTVDLADNPAYQAGVERGMAMVQNRYTDNSAVVTQQILNTPRTVFDFDPLGTRLGAFKDGALDWFAANGAATDRSGNGFLYGLNGAGYALTEALLPRSSAELVLGAVGGVVAGRAIGAGAAYLAREVPIFGESLGTLAGRGLDWAVDRLSPGIPYGSPAAQAGRVYLGAFIPDAPALTPAELRARVLSNISANRTALDASRFDVHRGFETALFGDFSTARSSAIC